MDLKTRIKAILLLIYGTFINAMKTAWYEGLRFYNDTRAESKGEYTAPVMMVIAGIIWVICIPIYIDAVQDTNTTGWTFTGATGATTLFLLMPFIFIAGGVVWILKKALA